MHCSCVSETSLPANHLHQKNTQHEISTHTPLCNNGRFGVYAGNISDVWGVSCVIFLQLHLKDTGWSHGI
jgi:hypothetical protein